MNYYIVSQTDVNSLEVYIKLRHALSLGKGRAKLVSAQQTIDRQLTIFQDQDQDQYEVDQDQDQFCQC